MYRCRCRPAPEIFLSITQTLKCCLSTLFYAVVVTGGVTDTRAVEEARMPGTVSDRSAPPTRDFTRHRHFHSQHDLRLGALAFVIYFCVIFGMKVRVLYGCTTIDTLVSQLKKKP